MLRLSPNVSCINTTIETILTHDWISNPLEYIFSDKCKTCNMILYIDSMDHLGILRCRLTHKWSTVNYTCNQYLVHNIIC